MNEEIKEILNNLDDEYRETIENDMSLMAAYGTLSITNIKEGIIVTNITDLDKKIIKYLRNNIEYVIIGVAHIKKTSEDLLKDLGSILEINNVDDVLSSIDRLTDLSILYLEGSDYSTSRVIEGIKIIKNINEKKQFEVDISMEESIFNLIL